jgi:hypothetical protein
VLLAAELDLFVIDTITLPKPKVFIVMCSEKTNTHAKIDIDAKNGTNAKININEKTGIDAKIGIDVEIDMNTRIDIDLKI